MLESRFGLDRPQPEQCDESGSQCHDGDGDESHRPSTPEPRPIVVGGGFFFAVGSRPGLAAR
ncbi:hypothetical protein [Mycolicibacterium smegmatis]|uniref:hypothetical protein n=1 Tax=Mycolicibacterium smegmatis TaxID=1772 RepID=UPI0018E549CB|nr:hypothetical protein [Mycolicibacterium smegmatis]